MPQDYHSDSLHLRSSVVPHNSEIVSSESRKPTLVLSSLFCCFFPQPFQKCFTGAEQMSAATTVLEKQASPPSHQFPKVLKFAFCLFRQVPVCKSDKRTSVWVGFAFAVAPPSASTNHQHDKTKDLHSLHWSAVPTKTIDLAKAMRSHSLTSSARSEQLFASMSKSIRPILNFNRQFARFPLTVLSLEPLPKDDNTYSVTPNYVRK